MLHLLVVPVVYTRPRGGRPRSDQALRTPPQNRPPPKFSSSPPSRLGFGLRPLPLAALPPVRLDQLGELILGLVPSQAHPTQVQGRLGGHDLSNLLDLGEAKVARRDHPVGAFQGEDVPARKEHAVHRDGRVALGADVNLRRRATHKIIKKKDIEHERKRHDMRAGGQSTIPLARTRCAALALILIRLVVHSLAWEPQPPLTLTSGGERWGFGGTKPVRKVGFKLIIASRHIIRKMVI